MEKELTGYNFATAGRVTRPHIVTIRAVAQGRTMVGAARTACGVVLLMVHPTPTFTTWIVVVGLSMTVTVRALFRCAVSQSCKIYNLGASPIIMRQAEVFFFSVHFSSFSFRRLREKRRKVNKYQQV